VKHLYLLALLALASCQPHDNSVSAAVAAAEAQAARDSTEAARLDTTARHYYALGKAAQDSATFYHLQSTHVQAQITAADSAALQRFFANYPAPSAGR
jgi:hypothetical protein